MSRSHERLLQENLDIHITSNIWSFNLWTLHCI